MSLLHPQCVGPLQASVNENHGLNKLFRYADAENTALFQWDTNASSFTVSKLALGGSCYFITSLNRSLASSSTIRTLVLVEMKEFKVLKR